MNTALHPRPGSRALRLALVIAAASAAAAGAQQAPPARPADSTSARPAPPPGRQNWTADRMPLSVGDIITVNVDEHLLASSDLKNAADEQRSHDLGLDVSTPSTSPHGSISSQNNGHSQSEGQSSRTNDFVGAVSARVVAVSPSGLLQITGTKIVALDKSSEEITIAGWIRPDDVSSSNTIDSWRIADAKLTYHSTGNPDKPKTSLLARLLGFLWP